MLRKCLLVVLFLFLNINQSYAELSEEMEDKIESIIKKIGFENEMNIENRKAKILEIEKELLKILDEKVTDNDKMEVYIILYRIFSPIDVKKAVSYIDKALETKGISERYSGMLKLTKAYHLGNDFGDLDNARKAFSDIRKEYSKSIELLTGAYNLEINLLISKDKKDEALKLIKEFKAVNKKVADNIEKEISILGSKVPDDKIEDVKEGKSFSIKDFRGKYILIDFWATWCGPCINEIPTIEEAHKRFNKSGLVVISISLDREKKDWLEFLKKHKAEWKQGHLSWEPGNKLIEFFSVNYIPSVFLIDPKGNVIAKNLRGEALIRKLEETFKEK
ncbi:MAG: TlpA family protein disulfide reductase [Candidatus Coatesbacteria bacterium]|nr:TlpA family protein disulfide reductase [Candidatus Coatesbacteria bacterium]